MALKPFQECTQGFQVTRNGLTKKYKTQTQIMQITLHMGKAMGNMENSKIMGKDTDEEMADHRINLNTEKRNIQKSTHLSESKYENDKEF